MRTPVNIISTTDTFLYLGSQTLIYRSNPAWQTLGFCRAHVIFLLCAYWKQSDLFDFDPSVFLSVFDPYQILAFWPPIKQVSLNFLGFLLQQLLLCISVSVKNVACVASVSVWFRSKARPRKATFGFDPARNAPFFARSLTLVPRSLLLNRTETLATQAIKNVSVAFSSHSLLNTDTRTLHTVYHVPLLSKLKKSVEALLGGGGGGRGEGGRRVLCTCVFLMWISNTVVACLRSRQCPCWYSAHL